MYEPAIPIDADRAFRL